MRFKRIAALTLVTMGVALGSAQCQSSSGSQPCMPNDPNNPNACQQAPPAQPASFQVGGHTVSWQAA
jgi:hypothetical protein